MRKGTIVEGGYARKGMIIKVRKNTYKQTGDCAHTKRGKAKT